MNDWPCVQSVLEATPSGRRGACTVRRLWRAGGARLPPGVYVLVYHSVVDGVRAESWERAYARVATADATFREHLAFLAARSTPLPLECAPELLLQGLPDTAYTVVTFDDGYANLIGTAARTCAHYGFEPTAFVNADFASGRAIYYRVLLAQLLQAGEGPSVAAALSRHVGGAPFEPERVSEQSKDRYAPGATEAALLEAWADRSLPRAHLDFEQLRALRASGWRIANHTRSHPTLRGLNGAAIEQEILGNHEELVREGLEPLRWLAYPNGTAASVGTELGEWMREHDEWQGAHANGGVNLEPMRDEWLRIPVAEIGVQQLDLLLRTEAARTRAALRRLGRSG